MLSKTVVNLHTVSPCATMCHHVATMFHLWLGICWSMLIYADILLVFCHFYHSYWIPSPNLFISRLEDLPTSKKTTHSPLFFMNGTSTWCHKKCQGRSQASCTSTTLAPGAAPESAGDIEAVVDSDDLWHIYSVYICIYLYIYNIIYYNII